jgi:hypothetical protein
MGKKSGVSSLWLKSFRRKARAGGFQCQQRSQSRIKRLSSDTRDVSFRLTIWLYHISYHIWWNALGILGEADEIQTFSGG